MSMRASLTRTMTCSTRSGWSLTPRAPCTSPTRLLNVVPLPGKEVLGQSVQKIGGEHHVVLVLACLGVGEPHYGNVHVDYFELVRLGYLQRWLQHVQQLADCL